MFRPATQELRRRVRAAFFADRDRDAPLREAEALFPRRDMASGETVPSGQRDSGLVAARDRAAWGCVDIRMRAAVRAAELRFGMIGLSSSPPP